MFSGNARDQNGDSFIPASQRPDGTWRKARRVKEGYVPQEEVPLYESKGKQFASRCSKPTLVNLPSGQVAHQSIPGLFIVKEKEKNKSKKKIKNIDEQLDQLKLTTEGHENSQSTGTNVEGRKKCKAKSPKPELILQKSNDCNQQVEPTKRLKNLKKRLREVEALEEKLNTKQIVKPEPEQLLKIKRKNDLLIQIRELEKLV